MTLDNEDLQKISEKFDSGFDEFGKKVDKKLDAGFGRLRVEVAEVIEQNINPQFDSLGTKMDSLEIRMGKLESKMVTKDYLDDKLADLRGDLVVLMRKEDTKVTKLIEVLQKKQVLNDEEAKGLLEMEPFSRMV